MKEVSVTFHGKEQGEGDGAIIRRFIGTSKLETLDPFIMVDWGKAKLPNGFPDHPHRGQQTITYLLSGEILHEDFKGHKGKLTSGDIQWMTVGKGIMHSEMPASFTETSDAFQIWINLPAKDKYCEPTYQHFTNTTIPVYQPDATLRAKVMAGDVFGVKGPVQPKTPTYFIDFNLAAGKAYEHMIPAGWNSFILVHKGSLEYGQLTLGEGDCAAFKISKD